MNVLRRYWAEIKLEAFAANLEVIQQHAPGKRIIAVVKADAYGHGDYHTAKELERLGVKDFAVSNLSEAASLRDKGVGGEILIFGATPASDFALLSKLELTQTVFSLAYAKELSSWCVAHDTTLTVQLKIDTGMGRMGLLHTNCLSAMEDALEVLALPGLQFAGIYTHLCEADSREEAAIRFTQKQIARFYDLVTRLEKAGHTFPLIHCQNSGGILLHEAPFCNACRPGLILYGCSPFEDEADDGLVPVMRLCSRVSLVKTLPADFGVSYGRHYTTQKETQVAVVPAGYADGYFRNLSKEGYLLIAGKPAKILGSICMDQMICDVSQIPEAKEGAPCVLMGRQGDALLSAATLAKWGNTISYEILCAVARRVPRLYLRQGVLVDELSYL